MQSTRWFKRWLHGILLAVLVTGGLLAPAESTAALRLSPEATLAGGADFTLTMRGINFTPASIAQWNGAAVETVYQSESELTAVIPASLIADSGVIDVTVLTDGVAAQSAEFMIQPATAEMAGESAPSGASTRNPAGTLRTAQAATPLERLNPDLPATQTAPSRDDGSDAPTSNSAEADLPAKQNSSFSSESSSSTSNTLSSSATSTKASIIVSTLPSFSISVGPPPQLVSLTPTSAYAGGSTLTLSITGANFTATSVVQWGAVALTTNYVSATQLTAIVPAALSASVGTASISVTDLSGTSSAAIFTLIQPQPSITSLSPASAVVGSSAFTLILNGTFFTSDSTAQWNTTNLATTYLSPTQLTVAVPASLLSSAGTSSITVSNSIGVSVAAIFNINPPAPTLTGISPASALAGGSSFMLTVSGTNFTAASTLTFAATPIAATIVSATKITATVPASLVSSVGTASIVVTNVTGSSPGATFTINQPPPTISSLSPSSTVAGGASLPLTINGTNFDASSVAFWGSTPLTTTLISTTQLTATLPAALIANPGSGSLTVTTDGGVSSTATFTILMPPPAITSLSPALALSGGAAFTLTLTGSNFTTASIAQWNSSSLTTTYVSATQLTAAVPASLITAAGAFSITVSTASGVSSAASFTVNPDAPTLTGLSPVSALAGGAAFTLTVSGSSFTSTSTLLWNGSSLLVTYKSATQLTATIPATLIASVGTASIVVTNVTGSSSATSFSILQPPPTLTGISPTSTVAGGASLLLTLSGTNFDATSVASWGSTALATTVVSSTQLTATLPAALTANYGTGSITVTTDGGATGSAVFTVIPQPPVITSLSPTAMPAGSAAFTLTINGSNFTTASIAQWNSSSLTTTYVSPTQVAAIVPASLPTSAGTSSITVSTTGGVSAAASFTINPAAPTLTGLSPVSTLAGGAAFTLTVSGTSFTSTSTLLWNGSSLPVTYKGATQLTATIPASLIASAGTASVIITNVSGNSPATSFSIVQPPPTLTSISPTSTVAGGANLLLTLSGANFDATSVASWGSTALVTTLVSSTQLTATLPAALTASYGTGSIIVTTDGGTTGATTFTILPQPPTLSSLTPTIAIAGSPAFTLNIVGANFIPTATVLWNSTSLTTTYLNATQLTAVVPASLFTTVSTPAITVSTTGGVSAATTLTVNPPSPVISSLSPNSALAGGAAFTLTINGTNFTSNSTLLWNGSSLPFTFNSATQLTATISAAQITSVGTYSMTVANITGTSPSASFTVNQPPPTLTSISPTSTVAGGAALFLTLSGTNFDATSIAYFGSKALATTFVSTTQLTATLPAAQTASFGSVSLYVITDGGTTTSSIFTVIPQPPTISSLSPTCAIVGGAAFTMTILGTNFTNASTVVWNTTPLSSNYVSATKLTAAIPASLIASIGTDGITVSTTGGVSTIAIFNVNPPSPVISSLTPNSVLAGSSAFTLTINGANFTASSTALWGSTTLAITYVNTTQLTAAIPASLIASTGTASVTVTNVTGTSAGSSLSILPPPPTISSLSPTSVLSTNSAFTMTVTGTNFQSGTSGTLLRWNTSYLPVTYVSSTQITAAVPTSLLLAGTANITVVTAGGTSSALPFNVIPPPPTLVPMGGSGTTALSILNLPAGFGTFTMSAYGANFTSSMVVNWGSTTLTGTLVGSYTYTFTVPGNLVATPGTVNVSVTTTGGTSNSISFTIAQPPPAITSISPASIPAGNAAFTLTLNGSNFVSGMTVNWNSITLTPATLTSTQSTVSISAKLVATAGTVGLEAMTTNGSSPATYFIINPAPPAISSLSPSSITAGKSGFLMTINGTAFTTTSIAMWGTTPLDTIYVSPTCLTASVPASLIQLYGSASISVVSAAGTSSTKNFNIYQAPPQIVSMSPGTALAGESGFSLTVNGNNFTFTSSVVWGTTILNTYYVSSTQLTADVPASLVSSPGTAGVTVVTPIGTSSTAIFTIIGGSALPSITTTSLPAATVGLPYSGPINVTGGIPGYSWTVTGLPSNFTYFNTSDSTLTITGTPASAGPISFQVSAEDTADNIAGPVTLTINVNSGPNGASNSSLKGSYTCLMQGSFDDDGSRWATLLNFQADGQGNFSNGIFDTNSYDIGSASGIVSGSYNIGSDNNGTASIHTILTNNAAGVQTTLWAIALSGNTQPATEFRMVEADDLGTLPSYQQGTAHCYLSTPSTFAASSTNGLSFAFAMDGEDNNSNLKTTAGRFTTSSGNLTKGYLDTSMGGSATDQPTAFTGTYTVPDSVWGRFTIKLSGAGNSSGYTVYMINASQMFILDNTSDDGEQAGNLSLQPSAATTAAALSGPFVLYNRGAQFNSNSGIPTSFYANLLAGTGDGEGHLTIRQSYANNAGSYAAGESAGGPTPLEFDSANPGRASFQTSTGTTYLYFYGVNQAFAISVGANGSIDSGVLESQSAALLANAFTSATLKGNSLFGEMPLLGVLPTAWLGLYSLTASGSLTANITTSAQGILSWDQSSNATYAWDTSVSGSGGFFLDNGAQGNASCASISATRFACIPQTDPAPSVQIMQQ